MVMTSILIGLVPTILLLRAVPVAVDAHISSELLDRADRTID